VAIKNRSRITVNVLHRKFSQDSARVATIAKRVLKEENIGRADLGIVLVGDAFMRRMNKRFFAKNKTTDVLSFDLRIPRMRGASLMADIVVCADRAVIRARRLKVPLKSELARYIIHGILHLTGYDDTCPSEKIQMWERQEYLLKKIVTRS